MTRLLEQAAACLGMLLVVLLPAAAEEGSGLGPRVEPIFVPADKPETWPQGDWVPVNSSEWNHLIQSLKSDTPAPRDAWIERATYTATFSGNALRAGIWRARVRHSGTKAALLPLDPLNLAVSELTWDDKKALWGTTPDDRTAVYVDRQHGELRGRWTHLGRTLPDRVDFDLQLPEAAATEIRLRVPVGYRVKSTKGIVWQVEDESETGWRTWRLDLGSRTRSRVTVVRQPEAASEPFVLIERDSSYVVGEDGLGWQAEFRLDVLDAPVNLLLFQLPSDVEVLSTTYGGEATTAWRTVSDGDLQLIPVLFPESLTGRSRPIRLLGIGPARLGEPWTLPDARLVAALQVAGGLHEKPDEFFRSDRLRTKNTSLLTGETHFRVQKHFEVSPVDSEGFLQTATIPAADGDAFTYRQFLPDAQLVVNVDYPALQLAATEVTHVDATADNWLATSEITTTSGAGSAFQTRYRVDPQWEITEVRASDESAETVLAGSKIDTATDGRRELLVEFREALSPGHPKTIEVMARRRPVPESRAAGLPILRPLNHRSVQSLVVLAHSTNSSAIASRGGTFTKIDRGRVPEFAEDSELWQRVRKDPAGKRLLLYSNSLAPSGTIRLQHSQVPVEARVWNTYRLDGSRLTETFLLKLNGGGRALDRVYLYLTDGGGSLDCRFPGRDGRPLEATAISPSRHAEWNLPPNGALWEVRLPEARRGQFEILAARTRPVNGRFSPALAVIPEAESFQGVAQLVGSTGWSIDFETRHLAPADLDEVKRDGFQPPKTPRAGAPSGSSRKALTARSGTVGPSSFLWRYGAEYDAELIVTARPPRSESQSGPLATLLLQSVISAEDDAADVHRAEYRIERGTHAGKFGFQLPEAASLISVELNDRPLTPARRGARLEVSPLMPEKTNTVVIQYRTPASMGFVRDLRRIGLPGSDATILRFEWKLALPPGLRIGNEPASVVLNAPPVRVSWSQRMFGPLGRPSGSGLYNPFSRESWISVFSAASTPAAHDSPEQSTFIPDGWRVHTATSPAAPGTLILETWQYSRIRRLAWAGLLFCLLIGLALRLLQFRARFGAAPLWLGACLIAAWVAPATVAEIAGGCLAGSLAALLFPRRLLERRTYQPEPKQRSASLASTVSAQVSSAVIVVLALQAGAQISGQEPAGRDVAKPAARETDDAVPQTIRTLVPTKDGKPPEETPSLIYVDRRRLDLLRESARSGRPKADYLVSSAEYSAVADAQNAVTVEARFRVAVLPSTDVARLSFPDVTVNPDDCLVNGEPHPILLGADGKRFAVELRRSAEALRRHDVEVFDVWLTLHPATLPRPEAVAFQMIVPPVASARLKQTFSSPQPAIEVRSDSGPIAAGDGSAIEADLGTVGNVEVLWSDNPELIKNPTPSLKATVTGLVTARPTWLEYRYHVDYQPKRSMASRQVPQLRRGIDYVGWRLPPGIDTLAVEEITVDGQPADYSFSAAGQERRLLILFQEPREEDFAIDARLIAPITGTDGPVHIPVGPLVEASGPQTVSIVSNQLGVRAPSEFELSPSGQPAGDQVSGIPADAFAGNGEEGPSLGKPQFTYAVSGPAELRFQLTPLRPARSARLLQRGTIHRNRIDWSVTAEVETTRAPAFHHRLLVDPALRITSISVRDDAERLARRSRRGRILDLFLSDRTTGTQTVTLSGSLPIRLEKPLRIPLVKVADAEITNSTLLLDHERELAVELLKAEALAPVEGAPSSTGDEQRAPDVGRFRILPDMPPPRFVARLRSAGLAAETVMRIDRLNPDSNSLEVSAAIRVRNGSRPGPFLVRIPSELAQSFDARIDGADYDIKPREGQAVDLSVRPNAADGRWPTLWLTATLAAGEAGQWELPLVTVEDASQESRYLVVPDTAPLRPAGDAAREVGTLSLPDWYRNAVDFDEEPAPAVFESDDRSLRLQRTTTAAEPSGRVALADTRVLLTDADVLGSTMLLNVSNGESTLDLAWKGDHRLRALFVDGQAATPDLSEKGILRIPLGTGYGVHLINVHWSRPKPETGQLVDIHEMTFPHARNVPTERTLVMLATSGRAAVLQRRGLTALDRAAHAASRLQAFLDVIRPRAASGQADDAVWAALLGIRRHLESGGKAAMPSGGEFHEETRLLAELVEQIDELRLSRTGQTDGRFEFDFEPAFSVEPVPRGITGSAMLLGKLPKGRGSEAGITFWLVDRRVTAIVFVLAGLLVLPVLFRLLKPETGVWMREHPSAAWLLLGLVWWLCLRPGVLGLLLMLTAVIVAVASRIAASRSPAAGIADRTSASAAGER